MTKLLAGTSLFLFAVVIGLFIFVGSIRKQLREVNRINMQMEIMQDAAIGQLETLQEQRQIEDSLRLLPSEEHEKLIDSIRVWNSNELKRFIESAVR